MSSFKLGRMTLASLARKPETVCYPFEEAPAPPALKGSIHNDISACILCGICDKRCPTGALAVDKKAGSWSIDRFRCVQCGHCVRECPKDCLSMTAARPGVLDAKTKVVLVKPAVETEDETEEQAAKRAARDAKLKAALAAKAARDAAKKAAEQSEAPDENKE